MMAYEVPTQSCLSLDDPPPSIYLYIHALVLYVLCFFLLRVYGSHGSGVTSSPRDLFFSLSLLLFFPLSTSHKWDLGKVWGLESGVSAMSY